MNRYQKREQAGREKAAQYEAEKEVRDARLCVRAIRQPEEALAVLNTLIAGEAPAIARRASHDGASAYARVEYDFRAFPNAHFPVASVDIVQRDGVWRAGGESYEALADAVEAAKSIAVKQTASVATVYAAEVRDRIESDRQSAKMEAEMDDYFENAS